MNYIGRVSAWVFGREHMYLNCKIGTEIKETVSAGHKGKVYKTPGAYLELIKPESSSLAFVWNKGSFQEISTSD